MSKDLIKTNNELTLTQEQAFQKAEEYLDSMGLSKKLTIEQRKQFLEIASAFKLNPFTGEIYGIGYFNKKENRNDFSIIVGYETYIKRAERSGKLAGWKAWTEGSGNDMKGCIEIHRKDWTKPFYHEVYFDEYNQQYSPIWKSKPRTMLKKVAIGQGFKLAFSTELGGMPYTAEEQWEQKVLEQAVTTKDNRQKAIEEERAKPDPHSNKTEKVKSIEIDPETGEILEEKSIDPNSSTPFSDFDKQKKEVLSKLETMIKNDKYTSIKTILTGIEKTVKDLTAEKMGLLGYNKNKITALWYFIRIEHELSEEMRKDTKGRILKANNNELKELIKELKEMFEIIEDSPQKQQ